MHADIATLTVCIQDPARRHAETALGSSGVTLHRTGHQESSVARLKHWCVDIAIQLRQAAGCQALVLGACLSLSLTL